MFFHKYTPEVSVGKPPDHYAAVIVWWRDEVGTLKTYVVDSTPTNPNYSTFGQVQTKIPGGRSAGRESFWDTACREFEEEVGLSIFLMMTPPLPIYVEQRGNHRKVVYLVGRENCSGCLREERLVEKNSIVNPPREISLTRAIREAYATEFNKFHRHALITAWTRLSQVEMEISDSPIG